MHCSGRSNEDGGYAMSAPVPWKATKSAHKDKKHKKKQKKKEKVHDTSLHSALLPCMVP